MVDWVTPSPHFWQGKRVFLTGHTGFKGAWLSLWLSRLGAVVRGYSLPVEPENALFTAARVTQHVDSIEGDIRDAQLLDEALATFKPDIVFHLAAQALVQRSYREPVHTFDVNVMGSIRVLEAARRAPSVRAVVVVTTDKCYENREWRSAVVILTAPARLAQSWSSAPGAHPSSRNPESPWLRRARAMSSVVAIGLRTA
jgi:CDP-glucose 4,6-dehydratase